MPSVAEYQKKYDEICEIREATKKDFSMSNADKRKIAREYSIARQELKAASKAATSTAAQKQTTESTPKSIDQT